MRRQYGIYTVGDFNFFAGVVAAVNSLRHHGCQAPVAVVDIGFEPWMVAYLAAYEGVTVLDIEPVRRHLAYTDVLTDESPVMKGWAYKAFAIVFYDLFDTWTFIDGDYLPLCDTGRELRPFLERGCFVGTEDGWNTWDERHREAIGVECGTYPNVNAGFVSLSMEHHGHIVHEWRNLMTRYRPFDLWYGDQGALNAILDKHRVERTFVDKVLWNQTWLNDKLAAEGTCRLALTSGPGGGPSVTYDVTGETFKGWHGAGWHKLWHQIGIDHYRSDPAEREAFHLESRGKSPDAITAIFEHFLFDDTFNARLGRNGFRLLEPS